MTQFDVEILRSASGATLRASGEVDLAVTDLLLEAGLEALDGPGPGLVVDLSGVSFIDSTGLGVLVRLRDLAGNAGKTFVLTNPSGSSARLLRITALDQVFTIVSNDVDRLDPA